MNGSQEGDNYVLFNSDIPNTTIYEQNTGELEYNVPPTLSTRCQPVLMTRDNFSQFNHFNYDLESMFGEPTYNSIELSRFNKWVIYYYYYTIHSLENKDITKLPINLTLIYLTTFRCKSFSVNSQNSQHTFWHGAHGLCSEHWICIYDKIQNKVPKNKFVVNSCFCMKELW